MKLGQYIKQGQSYWVCGENGHLHEFYTQCSAMLFSRMIRPSKDDGAGGARKKYDLNYISGQKEMTNGK